MKDNVLVCLSSRFLCTGSSRLRDNISRIKSITRKGYRNVLLRYGGRLNLHHWQRLWVAVPVTLSMCGVLARWAGQRGQARAQSSGRELLSLPLDRHQYNSLLSPIFVPEHLSLLRQLQYSTSVEYPVLFGYLAEAEGSSPVTP